MNTYSLINDISSNLSVNIIKAFCIKHDASWFENKTKTDYTLWTVLRGKIHLKINNTDHILTPGDTVLFYPEDRYTARCDDECEFLYIYFSLKMGHEIDLISGLNLSGIVQKKYTKNKSRDFCKKFIELYTVSQHASLELYSVFLNYISDIITVAQTDKFIHFYDSVKKKNTYMQNAVDYINSHIYDDIQTKQLAEIFHLSEKYFIRKFKATIGMSPGQYITQARMRKSVELITDTNIKIHEIAKMMGYADQYSFSKAFKKYYGEAPLHFRKLVNK